MTFEIEAIRPDHPDAVAILHQLDETLLALPYPPESRHAFDVSKLIAQKVDFFVLRHRSKIVACGGVKQFGNAFAEVKRMFVRPAFRGQGHAQAILKHIEEYAREHGIPILRLETGIFQTDAIRLYERFGFTRIPPFDEYRLDPNSVYFEKAVPIHS